jgi:hypothetical protein
MADAVTAEPTEDAPPVETRDLGDVIADAVPPQEEEAPLEGADKLNLLAAAIEPGADAPAEAAEEVVEELGAKLDVLGGALG